MLMSAKALVATAKQMKTKLYGLLLLDKFEKHDLPEAVNHTVWDSLDFGMELSDQQSRNLLMLI